MAIEDEKHGSEQHKLFSKVKYKITGRVTDEVSLRKTFLVLNSIQLFI